MNDIWERYTNQTPKEILTVETFHMEVSVDRKGKFNVALLGVLLLVLLIVCIMVFGVGEDVPPIFATSLLGELWASARTLLVMLIAIALVAAGIKLGENYSKRYNTREVGFKIVSAKVSGMYEDVYAIGRSGVLEERDYYLIFSVYGKFKLMRQDYTHTSQPMADMDVYYSTSVGDEFYLVVTNKGNRIAKVFPKKYFELSDELSNWCRETKKG